MKDERSFSRRDFLKVTGIGAAAAAGPTVTYNAWWRLWGMEDGTGATDFRGVPDGKTSTVSTTCLQCAGGCGLDVRVVEPEYDAYEKGVSRPGRRAVKISGNSSHPANDGSTCPRAETLLQMHYHPKRLPSPVRRSGGAWKPVQWRDAVDTVTRALRDVEDPRGIVVLDGKGVDDSVTALWKRFLNALGSPNHVLKPDSSGDERLMALSGSPGFYDLGEADHVLSLGRNFLDTFYSPIQAIRAFARLRERRVDLVYAGPRLSVTGIKASRWIPTAPRTGGLLALGIAKTLVEEGWHDDSAVRNYGSLTQFNALHGRLNELSRDEVMEKAGVEEHTVYTVAEDLASADAPVVVGTGTTAADEEAMSYLNLLAGGTDHWWTHDRNAFPYADPGPGLGEPGGKSLGFENLRDAALHGDPHPVEVIFIHYTNPVLSSPDPEGLKEALDAVPLVVNFSPFVDETARLSDLVLPDHSPLERSQDVPGFLLDGTPFISLARPVLDPAHDTRHVGDVLLDVARSHGGELSDALPWKSFEEYLGERLRGVYESGRGELRGDTEPDNFEQWIAALPGTPWWNPDGSRSPEEVELRSATVDEVLNRDEVPEFCSSMERRMDLERPFCLTTFKVMSVAKPRNVAQPSLFDVAAPNVSKKWGAWAELNPKAAEGLGISDGDEVWVESEKGRVKLTAKVTPGTVYGSVNVPLMVGSRGFEPWRREKKQENPFEIVDRIVDEDNRFVHGTDVKVYRA